MASRASIHRGTRSEPSFRCKLRCSATVHFGRPGRGRLGGLAWLESVAWRRGWARGTRRVGAASRRTTTSATHPKVLSLNPVNHRICFTLCNFQLRPPASLAKVHNILGRGSRAIARKKVNRPAREAKFRPVSAWVTGALVELYRSKGIRGLYSRQAATAELVRRGKNGVCSVADGVRQTVVLRPLRVTILLSHQEYSFRSFAGCCDSRRAAPRRTPC